MHKDKLRQRFNIRMGAFLCMRREALGMTQASVARAIGTNRSHICHLEKGQKEPSLHTLNKLCIALQMGSVLEGLRLLEAERAERAAMVKP